MSNYWRLYDGTRDSPAEIAENLWVQVYTDVRNHVQQKIQRPVVRAVAVAVDGPRLHHIGNTVFASIRDRLDVIWPSELEQ